MSILNVAVYPRSRLLRVDWAEQPLNKLVEELARRKIPQLGSSCCLIRFDLIWFAFFFNYLRCNLSIFAFSLPRTAGKVRHCTSIECYKVTLKSSLEILSLLFRSVPNPISPAASAKSKLEQELATAQVDIIRKFNVLNRFIHALIMHQDEAEREAQSLARAQAEVMPVLLRTCYFNFRHRFVDGCRDGSNDNENRRTASAEGVACDVMHAMKLNSLLLLNRRMLWLRRRSCSKPPLWLQRRSCSKLPLWLRK